MTPTCTHHATGSTTLCGQPAPFRMGDMPRCGRHVAILAADLDTIGVSVGGGGCTGALVRRGTTELLVRCGHVHSQPNYGVGSGQGAAECAWAMVLGVQQGADVDHEFAAVVARELQI